MNYKSMYRVEQYNSKYYDLWNGFVEQSKNGTFLFHRDFMEYHSDRFDDFSLLVFEDDKLKAVLPGNIVGDTLYSHQGLSYGGLVLSMEIKFNKVLICLFQILNYLDKSQIKYLIFKEIPSIYNQQISDEFSYLMFVLKAELIKSEVLSVISLKNRLAVSKDRIKGLKRAKKHNLEVIQNTDFEMFWNSILIKNLHVRYGVKPVHSCNDILKLYKSFPQKIKFYGVYNNKKMVAGTVIFESENVAHSQYISADNDRNALGSLDILHFYLLNEVYTEKSYFDFGSSNVDNGKRINTGLMLWKEGFGARTLTQSFYKIKVKNFILLENVML